MATITKLTIGIFALAGFYFLYFAIYTLRQPDVDPEVNGELQEINIKTGQARFSDTFQAEPFNTRVEDTAFSLALDGEVIDVADIDPWQTVNYFEPGSEGVSGHYNLHGALAQVRMVEEICAQQPDPIACTAELAREVMTRWQESGAYFSAADLIGPLWNEATEDD